MANKENLSWAELGAVNLRALAPAADSSGLPGGGVCGGGGEGGVIEVCYMAAR